jgi:hypothetical protein
LGQCWRLPPPGHGGGAGRTLTAALKKGGVDVTLGVFPGFWQQLFSRDQRAFMLVVV